MERERFDAMIAAYGADRRRWPEGERADALALMQADAIDVSEARALDVLLDCAASLPGPSDLLTHRILRAAPRPALRPARLGWAIAATVLMGALMGYGAGRVAPVHGESEEMIAAALDPLSGGELMR